MHVGTLRVRLLIREARTLKDKRQVLRSICDRLRNGFHVSVAEVDAQDKHQLVVLGIALVGSEAYPVRHTLERIVEALDQPRLAVLGMATVGPEAHPLKQTFGRIVEVLRSHPVAELLDSEVDV